MGLEIKKDPALIVSSTVLAIALIVLCAMKVITWQELLVGLGILLHPSIAGRTDGTGDKTEPPSSDIGVPPGTLGIFFLAFVATTEIACVPATPEEKAAAAESSYAAQQLECVDKAKTREESQACRQKVRDAWAKDAGADQ